MRKVILAFGFAATSLLPLCVGAQEIRVLRPVNLRSDPSTDQTPIRLLTAATELRLAESEAQNGFLAVETMTGEAGWVWAKNVKSTAASAAHPLSVATPEAAHGPCLADGDAVPGSPDEKTDKLKIRTTKVSDSDIDSHVTLAALLAPGEDLGRFDQTHAATLEGTVLLVKSGGQETVNCYGAAETFDTHMDLVATGGIADEAHAVVVEVTPQWRAIVANGRGDWSTSTLTTKLANKRVRITGWLLQDWRHKAFAAHTGKPTTKFQRATVWEIHPITRIQVFESGRGRM
jgi:hypothetical protein